MFPIYYGSCLHRILRDSTLLGEQHVRKGIDSRLFLQSNHHCRHEGSVTIAPPVILRQPILLC